MTTKLAISLRHQEGPFALNVDFEIGPGITALFGPSGAGKTMILDCIAGLRQPTQGKVSGPKGTLLDTQNQLSLAPHLRGIGYVFQHGRLFPHMTVWQNLTYGARWRVTPQPGPDENEVLQILGLEPLLSRSPYDLSGGEQQRVAIGRAFLSRPDWLLMDEPLSALDTPRRLEILPFLEHLSERFQIPVLYVSHNADEVLRLADQVVLIDEGQRRDQGPVHKVFNDPKHFAFLGGADASGEAAARGTLIQAKLVEHDIPFNLSRVQVKGLTLWIPRVGKPIGSQVRLRLKASDIAIYRSEPQNSSILNTFQAEITQISNPSSGQCQIELKVSDEITLSAQITMRSATRLELAPGQKIWGAIKSVAVVTGARPVLMSQGGADL